MANLVLAAVYALTILAGAAGENNHYYLLGSAVEVVVLVAIAVHAWSRPRTGVVGERSHPPQNRHA